MKKTIALHQQGSNKHANDEQMTDGKYFYYYSFYIFIIFQL